MFDLKGITLYFKMFSSEITLTKYSFTPKIVVSLKTRMINKVNCLSKMHLPNLNILSIRYLPNSVLGTLIFKTVPDLLATKNVTT